MHQPIIVMNITRTIISALLLACPLLGMAQSTPAIAPSFTYTDSKGNEQTVTSADDQAPLAATFHANATDTEGWNAHYEWHFYLEGQRSNPYLVRYETDTQYTFTKAGTHLVELWATFVQGNDTIAYTDTYWQNEGTPLSIAIAESKLEMPNAFSPNGDGINDVYKVKSGYRSIVEFHAMVFSRSGKKLYEWHDISGGWDGRSGGHDCPDGAYYLNIQAKGADGHVYNIRKTINLLRTFQPNESATR